jgi:hypothetical protein
MSTALMRYVLSIGPNCSHASMRRSLVTRSSQERQHLSRCGARFLSCDRLANLRGFRRSSGR